MFVGLNPEFIGSPLTIKVGWYRQLTGCYRGFQLAPSLTTRVKACETQTTNAEMMFSRAAQKKKKKAKRNEILVDVSVQRLETPRRDERETCSKRSTVAVIDTGHTR